MEQDNIKGVWFSNQELETYFRLQREADDYLSFLIRMKRGSALKEGLK